MLGGCRLDHLLDVRQLPVCVLQVNFLLAHRRADVAGDVEVEPNSARVLGETDNAQRWAKPD